jgi:hypothetical protein
VTLDLAATLGHVFGRTHGGGDTLLPLAGRTLPRRLLTPRHRSAILVRRRLQRFDLSLGLRQAAGQAWAAAQRRRAGVGSHFQAVLSHARQLHQSLMQQGGHAVAQQSIQPLNVFDAEVGETVVVHGHAATEPLLGQALLAQLIESSGTADALKGGVQSQSHEDTGIIGIAAGDAFARLDALVEGREVEGFDVGPDASCLMVVGQELVEGQAADLDLVTLREAKTAMGVWVFIGLV